MRTTIGDVAARAGVSKTTVSRVLNGRLDVGVETAARVQQVIAELQYVPISGAVGLARGLTRVIGVMVPSLQWPWMGDVLQGAIDSLERQLYGVLVFTCTRGDESMRRFSNQASAKAFDGLVVIEPEGTLDYLTSLHASGLPVVMIDDRSKRPDFPTVATTNVQGAQDAAEHLLALGRRRPAVIAGPDHYGCIRERLSGFAAPFAAAGRPIPAANVVAGDFTFDGGVAAAAQLCQAGIDFDSLFVHNDLSAAGALRELRRRGRRVPDDEAVIGFDDVDLAGHVDPPLTTVRQPMRDMGCTAADLLVALVEGQAVADQHPVIATTLVVRESCGAAGQAAGAAGGPGRRRKHAARSAG